MIQSADSVKNVSQQQVAESCSAQSSNSCSSTTNMTNFYHQNNPYKHKTAQKNVNKDAVGQRYISHRAMIPIDFNSPRLPPHDFRYLEIKIMNEENCSLTTTPLNYLGIIPTTNSRNLSNTPTKTRRENDKKLNKHHSRISCTNNSGKIYPGTMTSTVRAPVLIPRTDLLQHSLAQQNYEEPPRYSELQMGSGEIEAFRNIITEDVTDLSTNQSFSNGYWPWKVESRWNNSYRQALSDSLQGISQDIIANSNKSSPFKRKVSLTNWTILLIGLGFMNLILAVTFGMFGELRDESPRLNVHHKIAMSFACCGCFQMIIGFYLYLRYIPHQKAPSFQNSNFTRNKNESGLISKIARLYHVINGRRGTFDIEDQINSSINGTRALTPPPSYATVLRHGSLFLPVRSHRHV